MDEILIVDASPLILLSRIDRLDLLESLAEQIWLPQSVVDELEAGRHLDEAAERVLALSGNHVLADIPLPEQIHSWGLGAGESQVLAFGMLSQRALLVLDDLAARRCAKSLQLPLVGSLGIALLCKHRGLIPKARPIVESLAASGLRLRPEFMDAALAKVGE